MKIRKIKRWVLFVPFVCGILSCSQKEVADLLGISQSYISRLEKKIMVRLRKEMVKYS
jgi:DNA-directed RNA polymerase specialized sigma subunit